MNIFRDNFTRTISISFFLKNLNEICLSSSRSEESRPPTACPASDSAVRWMAVRQPLEMNYFHLQEVTKINFIFSCIPIQTIFRCAASP